MAPVHRMPLRGRDEEVDRATAVLESAALDGVAGALVVRGPAGSGKSRLLQAVADAAVVRDFRLLAGSGDADAISMPLAPLLQVVLGGTPSLMNRRAVQEALRVDEARYVVIEEMIEALEHAAREQSLLVTIDDLQFSDPTTLFALRVMAERLATESIVWMVATREPVRDDAVAKTIDRLETLRAETLSVSHLAPVAATRIAEDLVGGSLDENLQGIVDRAEGQVLDLVETLRGLIDEERIDIVDGRAKLDESSVPMRLRDAIGRRLARLDSVAIDVVTTASVIGRQIGVPVIAALSRRSTEDISAALHAAEHVQLVINVNGHWTFRHDLIREAVELTLSPEQRSDLRRSSVDVQLETGAPLVEVASALAATARAGDGHAADLLEQAARDVASFDPSNGADLVGRAAAISVGDPARRGRLLAQQVMLLWQAGRAADAQLIGDQALMAGLDPMEEAEVRLGLARVTSQHSYPEAGRQAAAALALPGLSDRMRAKLLAAQCVVKILTHEFDHLEAELAEALQLARAVGDHESEASLLATRSTLSLYHMDWTAAFDEAERGRRVGERSTGETSIWAPKSLWQAILLSTAGSCRAAAAITDQGIAEASATRGGSALSLWMMIRCRTLLEAGRLSDAQVEAEAVLTMTDWRERSAMADYTVNFVLRRVAQYTGDPIALNRTQAAAVQMARDGVSSVRRQGKWLAAIDADNDGRPDVAIDLTAEGVDAYGGLGSAFSLDPADEPLFGRIAVRAGRPDLAIKAAEFTEIRAQRNPHIPLLQAVAIHARGLVDDDPDVLAAAANSFVGIERPLPRAAALEDAGRVNPQRDRSIHLLDQAHDAYVEAGALRDAARVRQRLRGLGQRRRQPRQAATAGDKLAGLTQSELAVVELVARGATNREVAAQLFLSPHTVSTHLRHAFNKVGVRSRTELARLTTLTERAT